MKRDPRIDPQPGDRVRGEKASAIIRVTARDDTPLGVEFVTGDGKCYGKERTSIGVWREWCRGRKAEVVEEAPDD